MTAPTRPTHEEGIAKAEAWCAETGVPMYELRRIASWHLHDQMVRDYGPDHPYDIGSSDTSIHLAYLANYEPESLFDAARPLVIVASSAKASGKTYEESRAAFAELFAPA